MAKRPAFQYYPGDLKRDTALQSCTFYSRSVWREMLDHMHDGEPYGHLTANGEPISDIELARMIGEPAKKVIAAIAELERKKVFSRTDTGVIYSRRMVRDEEIRTKRAAGGVKGGNPQLLPKVNHADNLAPNLVPTPASASAVASASASAFAKNATTDATAVDDVENFVSLAIVTANVGMKESLGEAFQPILTSHASRQYVFDWIAAGIPRERIITTITLTAQKAGKQISSMRYFDKPIREAHDRAQSVIHPDSQAGAVKARGPAAESPQSQAKRTGKLKQAVTDEEVLSKREDEQRRVEAWKTSHADQAESIWNEIRDDLHGKGVDALGQKHFENAIEVHFRKRIIEHHLTPKLAAG